MAEKNSMGGGNHTQPNDLVTGWRNHHHHQAEIAANNAAAVPPIHRLFTASNMFSSDLLAGLAAQDFMRRTLAPQALHATETTTSSVAQPPPTTTTLNAAMTVVPAPTSRILTLAPPPRDDEHGIRVLLEAASTLKPMPLSVASTQGEEEETTQGCDRNDKNSNDKSNSSSSSPSSNNNNKLPQEQPDESRSNEKPKTTKKKKRKKPTIKPRPKVDLSLMKPVLPDTTDLSSDKPQPARTVTSDSLGSLDAVSSTAPNAQFPTPPKADAKYFAVSDVVENTVASFFWVGRGGYGITHPGNMHVRSVIQSKAVEYASLRRNHRGHMATDILRQELKHVQFVAPRDAILANLEDDDRKEALGKNFVRKVSQKRRACLIGEHGSLELIKAYPDDVCVKVGQAWVLDILNHQLREEAEALRRRDSEEPEAPLPKKKRKSVELPLASKKAAKAKQPSAEAVGLLF